MSKRSKFIFTTIWPIMFFILAIGCQLWGLDPEKKINQYKEDKWEIAEGLPTNEILSISQTPDGYIWLATKKGLVRYDGVKFSIISFADKKKIAPIKNIIPEVLYLDRTDILWIGGEDALTSYNYKTGQFKTLTRKEGFSGERIRRIIDDNDGNLWISLLNNYVARYSNGKFYYFNSTHGLSRNKINSILLRKNNQLMFGSRENGMYIYKNGKFSEFDPQNLSKLKITSMCEDSDGDIWIGLTTGLCRLSKKSISQYTTYDGLSSNYVSTIIEDSHHTLWIGTSNGINRILKNKYGSLQIEPVLKGFMTSYLFEDKEKNLWIGTLESGLKRLKDMKIISLELPGLTPQDSIMSTTELHNGDILIGTLNGSLFRFKENLFIETLNIPELQGTAITAIAEDYHSDLWIGTNDKGVLQKTRTKTLSYAVNNGLPDNTIISIVPGKDTNCHKLWIITSNAVTTIQPGTGQIHTFNKRNGLIGENITSLIEDKNHYIWIGTNKGLTVLNNGNFQSVGYIAMDSAITGIYEDAASSNDNKHVFWVTTFQNGFKRLEIRGSDMNQKNIPSRITSFTTAQGMLTNQLFQFVEDSQGFFWIKYDTGILRLNKAELNRFAVQPTSEITCVPFSKPDGMKNIEFNSGISMSSILKTKKGELWFNTLKGISLVVPSKISIDKTPPYVIVEAISHDGKIVTLSPNTTTYSRAYTLRNKSEKNGFTFYFTVPTFVSPEKVRFKYKLEGYDGQWIEIPRGGKRFAYYQNINPGSYHFHVIACNADGVWNLTGDSVALVIESSFLLTLRSKFLPFIFVIAGIGFLIGIHFYLHKKRLARMEEQKRNEAVSKDAIDSTQPTQAPPTNLSQPVAQSDETTKRTPINPEYAKELIKNLTYQMEVNKLYRDFNTSLTSLSETIKTTSHILSQLLNENMKQNYADYVNTYRINEAKSILENPSEKNKKITTIAGDVGFNTMAAFYNAFKKATGKTPSEYKREFEKKGKS